MNIIVPRVKPITNAEKKLWYYYSTNPREQFDRTEDLYPHRLTWEDKKLANKYMAARIAGKAWANVVGRSIKDVNLTWDLFAFTESRWKECQQKLAPLLQSFLNHKGIGCANLSKVLHRKRPKFIPMCDSIVIKSLQVQCDVKKSETILACMDKLREIGKANQPNIVTVRQFLKQQDKSLEKLTDLRIVEKLIWLENFPYFQKVFKQRAW